MTDDQLRVLGARFDDRDGCYGEWARRNTII
jgi:hypothetical protein